MPNLRRQPVGFDQFRSPAVLGDGLLAVQRPGGELESQIASSLFGLADHFRGQAERTAQKRGIDQAKQQIASASPDIAVTGGDAVREVPPGPHAARAEPSAPGAAIARSGVENIVAQAALRHGVPVDAMLRIGHIESGLNPAAKNAKSSAGGLFQQTDGNAAQYGVSNRFDAAQSADGAARFMRDNIAKLTRVLGRPPTTGELYLAHQQGGGGAVALLANPGARAIDVVGRDAVEQNGGNATMTAGEFAQMWTSKAGNAPVTASPLGKVVGRTPLNISVSNGSPQLLSRDTIFSRAYNETLAQGFKAQLEDRMLTAAQDISQKFADDPDQMRFELQRLRDTVLHDDVPAAIRNDASLAFGRIERAHVAQAQAKLEKKIEEQDQGAWFGRQAEANDAVSRATEGLDPAIPETLTVLEAQAARQKDIISEGVSRGWIKPAVAIEQARRIDGDVAVASRLAEAKDRSLEELRTYREVVTSQYAEGKLTGVDADSWGRIKQGLDVLERGLVQDQQQAGDRLSATAKSFIERAAGGYEINRNDIDAFMALAEQAPDGQQIADDTMAVVDIGLSLRNGPIGVAESKVKAMRDAVGKDPSPREIAKLQAVETMLHKTRLSLATDLIGHAERMGVIAPQEVITNAQTPDDFRVMMESRLRAGDRAAEHFGVPPRYFHPGEVTAIEKMALENPETGAMMAGSVILGAGDRAGQVLKEFGKTAPVLAGAGMIIANNGSIDAARDALAGAGKDANGKSFDSKGWQARKAASETTLGIALRFRPDDQQRVIDTAERIARKRISDAGVTFDSDEAAAIHERAVQEAAGAVFDGDVQYGGLADYDPTIAASGEQVLVPNSIVASRFQDVIEAVQAGDVPVQPKGGIGMIYDLHPVRVGNGYVFVDMASDTPRPLMGEDGKPFILDIEHLLPVLGTRVPNAIRGY